MSTPHTSFGSNDSVASRRRPIRTAAAGIGATVLIAAGAYTITHVSSGLATQPTPTTREHVPSERAMREMRVTIRALYGSQPRPERSRRSGA